MSQVSAILRDIDYSHGVIVAERTLYDASDTEQYIEATWSGVKDLELGRVYKFLYSDKMQTYILQN